MVTSSTEPVTLALVNDYEVVVRGLAQMLAPYEDLRVVELDSNTEPATQVDVALFDTFAQEQGAHEEVLELVRNRRVRHVVLYSWNLDAELQQRSLEGGVSGYLSKSMSAEELAEAVRRVAAGARIESTVEDAGDDDAEPVTDEADWPGRDHGLTARESEVLALITQGLSNQQIAARTHLSINSVKTYIRHAYAKIGVTSRSRAVLWGIDHGFRPDRVRTRVG